MGPNTRPIRGHPDTCPPQGSQLRPRRYRCRNQVERGFNRRKQLQAVATRPMNIESDGWLDPPTPRTTAPDSAASTPQASNAVS
jgi:hypothetical protein